MSNPRFIECPRCDGGDDDYGRCRVCNGSGVDEIEDESVAEWEIWPEERE